VWRSGRKRSKGRKGRRGRGQLGVWQHVRSRNRWLVPGAAVGDTVVEREKEKEREIAREGEGLGLKG